MRRFVRIMNIGRLSWLLLTAFQLLAGAQAPEPRQPQIVQIQLGHSSVWSTSPSESVTTFRSKSVTISARDPIGQSRETESKYPLSSQQWQELRAAVDSRVLAALAGTIGCPGCADQDMEWVEVQFDDGTKKSAFYDAGSGPPELAVLIQRVQSISSAILPLALPIVGQSKKPVRVVSIRFGEWSGSCDADCSEELQVSAGAASLRRRCFREAQLRNRNFTVRADLSDKHWNELVQLIDRARIYALPDRTSDGSCGEFAEVKFSDHSRKKLSWATDGSPKELRELRDKLQALRSKLERELPK